MLFFKFSRRPNVQQLKSDQDVDGLIEALKYKDDHNVRLAAASALGRIKDSRAVEPLISALEDHPSVREVAALALGEIGDLKNQSGLFSALHRINAK